MAKPVQQIVAGQAGLKCSNTKVSNHRDSFMTFSEAELDLIMKTFSGNKILP